MSAGAELFADLLDAVSTHLDLRGVVQVEAGVDAIVDAEHGLPVGDWIRGHRFQQPRRPQMIAHQKQRRPRDEVPRLQERGAVGFLVFVVREEGELRAVLVV